MIHNGVWFIILYNVCNLYRQESETALYLPLVTDILLFDIKDTCDLSDIWSDWWGNMTWPYILKGGSRGSRNPQTILNFPQKDCLRSRKVSRLHCLQSFWLSFPLIVQSLLNFSITTLKHSIFSKKCPIHTKFFVTISALFPQIFWNWKAQSADFIAFRMNIPGM